MLMNDFLNRVEARNPDQPEFMQAVHEVVESVWPVYESTPEFYQSKLLDLMVEPERQISFRVSWMDDNGKIQVNRAYRIQYNSALGPYKGGMRFHPTVNQSILKFLGFEQTFKNSLTMLAMGGGKGGADFDPKGKSDHEVRRFCKNMMMELYRHIGPDVDVPAGDIGVGQREIGYMFGAYGKIKNDYTGVLTGRSLGLGGSPLRSQATGFGVVYFVEEMLKNVGDSLEGKRVAVSGSGNVAQYAMKKLEELGGLAITASDSSGYVYDPEGIKGEKLDYLLDLKQKQRGRISEYAKKYKTQYFENKKPWDVACDIALPCASQNELYAEDAKELVKNGVKYVAEGANMPTTPDAMAIFKESGVLFAPGKASNAGGVATSGFEMSQTSQRLNWEPEEVDRRLKGVMQSIHAQCAEHGAEKKQIDYVKGANVAGFIRVANAMISRGLE